MSGSLITNILVYTQNCGSSVTSSIVLKTKICDSPNNTSIGLEVENVLYYTPGGATKIKPGYGLHTNSWFTNYQCYGLHIIWRFT